MNTQFEEVLIENFDEQEHAFRFPTNEDHFISDTIYEMNTSTSPDNNFNHHFLQSNLINHIDELPINTLSAQFDKEQCQTTIKTEVVNQRTQLEHFTSSFKFPTVAFSLSNEKSPQIINVVATANLNCKIVLKDIELKIKHAEYNPETFKAVRITIEEPQVTAFLFSSGKIICTGTKSENSAKKAVRKVAKIIHKLGYPIKFSDFKIKNIVESIHIRKTINLKEMEQKNNQFCSYNPDLFPGLILRMPHLRVITIIFPTGEMIFTGTNDRNDIFKAFTYIFQYLHSSKRCSI